MTDAAEIVRLAARGDGVTADGLHVPGTAPGDIVDAAGLLLTPGPHHLTPACRHYDACGGCQLQHVDDTAYAAFVVERIAGALAGQGIDMPPTEQVHLSPPGTRRRAALKALPRGRGVLIGFNEAESHRLVDLAECPVLHPALEALLAPLRTVLAGLLPRHGAGVTLTLCDQGVDMMLDRVELDGAGPLMALTDFAHRHWLARLTVDQGYGPEPLHAPEPSTITLGGVAVPLPPGAFLQATADGEAALVAAVTDIVAGAGRIADLFAGLGTFALPLSRAARVTAVEGAGAAIAALSQGARQAGRAVAVQHRDLFRDPLDAAELGRFDAIVLDPPRAGAKAQARTLAAASGVERVAMVSCNPSSFARDARTLIDGGWRLQRIWPVGQFRWSTHVELVAEFTR